MEHERCRGLATMFGHVVRRRLIAVLSIAVCLSAASSERASADNGGLSFWLPGTFGQTEP